MKEKKEGKKKGRENRKGAVGGIREEREDLKELRRFANDARVRASSTKEGERNGKVAQQWSGPGMVKEHSGGKRSEAGASWGGKRKGEGGKEARHVKGPRRGRRERTKRQADRDEMNERSEAPELEKKEGKEEEREKGRGRGRRARGRARGRARRKARRKGAKRKEARHKEVKHMEVKLKEARHEEVGHKEAKRKEARVGKPWMRRGRDETKSRADQRMSRSFFAFTSEMTTCSPLGICCLLRTVRYLLLGVCCSMFCRNVGSAAAGGPSPPKPRMCVARCVSFVAFFPCDAFLFASLRL